ncbi:MAG: GTPase HflX, partial [Verrucomicrobia bacterium]|nr:GTPase HflX [Verrucomicrobiota bacterium]
STLLNALTGAHELEADKLIATLYPTTPQLSLRGNQKLLVTDTVGFIRRLPHGLVEAFKATLEEVVVANFLIHVLDVTNPNFEHHHGTTLSVLAELGAADTTIVTVFNKIDAAVPEMLTRARRLCPEALFVSARTRAGLDTLESRSLELIADALGSTDMLVPHDRYDVIARLHTLGHIHEQEHEDGGVRVKGRFPPSQTGFFAPFVVAKAN